jgi:hypothetical protein
MSPHDVISSAQRGTIYVFRGGVYNENYGGDWGARNFALGPSCAGISLVSTEAAQLVRPVRGEHGNIILRNGVGFANDVNIAGFVMQGGAECIYGGGYWEDDESGAKNVKVAANTFSADYEGNTMTALVSFQGDEWGVLGNIFQDSGWSSMWNNNHAIYAQVGSDDVVIAYNHLRRLQMGHLIQFHTDGTPRLFERAEVHHNLLESINNVDTRGITFSNIDPASTGSVHHNICRNLGQNFSAMCFYNGIFDVTDNVFEDILGPAIAVNGEGSRRVTGRRNTFTRVSGNNYHAYWPANLADIDHD